MDFFGFVFCYGLMLLRLCFFFFNLVLKIETRTLFMLGKCSATEIHPSLVDFVNVFTYCYSDWVISASNLLVLSSVVSIVL